MQKDIIIIDKQVGETPLECIQKIRKNNPNLNNLPITYAGRLDPLAEGVLILLVGDEVYKKDEYLNLLKEYELDILFGFATDTYDLMGLITDVKNVNLETQPDEIVSVLKSFIGKINQNYPPYSSRTVEGKPLFSWAREGKIGEIEIPSHKVSIESIEIIKELEISSYKLLEKIENDIGRVKGDFRQEEILKLWHKYLDGNNEKFKILKVRVLCGSGVYVRVLANDIGKSLGIPALALHIKRTKVGEFSLK